MCFLGEETKFTRSEFSPFGGTPEDDDGDIFHAAARECYEESMGFLGSKEEILNMRIQHNVGYRDDFAIIFTIHIKYDDKLSKLFRDIYKYTMEGAQMRNYREGYYEKTGLRWFTAQEIIDNKNIIRPIFYNFFQNVILKDLNLVSV